MKTSLGPAPENLTFLVSNPVFSLHQAFRIPELALPSFQIKILQPFNEYRLYLIR